LEFAKFHIENIPSDYCASPVLYVSPYFDNVKQASGFGCEVVWQKNETLHAIPYMQDISETESFKIPDPETGLWGKTIKWWHEMQELCKEVKLEFNDCEGHVAMAPIHQGGPSPHMVAVEMAGTELYAWILEEPEMYHAFLEKICKGLIGAEENARKIDGMYRGGYGLAEDSSTILSAEMFKNMVVPYTKVMYEKFGKDLPFGRGMHICGPANHLIDALADDLRISSFDSFGYMIDLDLAAEKFKNKTVLLGNVNPMFLKDASKSEAKLECKRVLEKLAPCGGFCLSDGANICPGTPLENLAAFVEAAQEFELPEELKMEVNI